MNRLRQRGFLLNPYRFAGTVQSGAFSADGVGGVTLVGASTATAVASMDGAGTMTGLGSTVQTASGAFSSDGVGAVSIVGASIASGSVSSDGSSVGTFASESTAQTVDAADFDGTNDKLSRASAMTGQADSKTGILSFWHRGTANPAGAHAILVGDISASSIPIIEAYWYDNGLVIKYHFDVLNSAGTVVVRDGETGGYPFGVWRHLLWSFDALAGVSHLYVNDVSDNAASGANTNAGFASINRWNVGDYNVGGNRLNGCLAELYFAPGQFLDFSVAANRRKFISSTGKPVNLGATGSTPTGSAPLIYLHLDDLETANNFATNRTGAGNLTVTGALGTCATSPSD